jgi:hypothetical protein
MTNSQIFGTECTAQANSGLFDKTGGIMAYLQLGIDHKKLVFGLPWYGYDYNRTATGSPSPRKCNIARLPFRGVNCSNENCLIVRSMNWALNMELIMINT